MGKKAKKRRERLNDGDNNGQATHGARKHAWRTQAAWAKKRLNNGNNNGQLRIATPPRVAHAKPPGPISILVGKKNAEPVLAKNCTAKV